MERVSYLKSLAITYGVSYVDNGNRAANNLARVALTVKLALRNPFAELGAGAKSDDVDLVALAEGQSKIDEGLLGAVLS
jgi:hypothetical protein